MLLQYAQAELKQALANTTEDKKAQVSELLADYDKKCTELNDLMYEIIKKLYD